MGGGRCIDSKLVGTHNRTRHTPAHAFMRAHTSAEDRLVEGMLLHDPAVEWLPSCG